MGYRLNLTTALLSCVLMSGCSTGAYLWQAASGHWSVLSSAQRIEVVLAQPNLSDRLRTQLQYVQQIRDYSVSALALPANASYTSYAELGRAYVVWNVVASPADSLDLKTWCFPLTGCISYRGYYRESDAVAFAGLLRNKGLDVAVMGVPAYSTLGFTPDPVLSSFVYYPAGELARLIFHELAHQLVYIPDDSTFNESFATALEALGVQTWLGEVGREDLREQYEKFDTRRVAFRQLLAQAHSDLKQIYGRKEAVSTAEKLQAKSERLDKLQQDYAVLKASWNGWAGYDRFMSEDVNNAKLGVSGLYNQHVPAFNVLFDLCGRKYPSFYEAVRLLGQRPRQERELVLAALTNRGGLSGENICSGQGFDSIVQDGSTVFKYEK